MIQDHAETPTPRCADTLDSPPPIHMLESLGLNSSQIDLLSTIALDLSKIPGVAAVVLGGSYARGTARPDSDIDVAIYYSEKSPPEIAAIRQCAEKISSPDHPPTVAGFYKWGPWVNGGAWIHTPGGKLDLLYRNIDQLQRVLDESGNGIYHHDYYQQPTFGFVSVIYLAETKYCLPLYDPQNLFVQLKQSVATYPPRLRDKLIHDCLLTAEFTLSHAHTFSDRGDILNTIGCLTKVAYALSQALFALNGEYYFGDKGSLEALEHFSRKPEGFSRRLQETLAMLPGTPLGLKSATAVFQVLWKATVDLSYHRYTPRFGLPG
jgi:predicted nucleotidyltransferase